MGLCLLPFRNAGRRPSGWLSASRAFGAREHSFGLLQVGEPAMVEFASPVGFDFAGHSSPKQQISVLAFLVDSALDCRCNATASHLLGFKILDGVQQHCCTRHGAPFLRAVSVPPFGGQDHLLAPRPPYWLRDGTSHPDVV